MDLPVDFVRNIRQSFPADGEKWLAELPELLYQAACQWSLELGGPLLLSYNYVCAATRKDGTQAVFKIGVPNRELTNEIKGYEPKSVAAGQPQQAPVASNTPPWKR